VDWLNDIGMIQAGAYAAIDSFIGWYEPYATSHDDLDRDKPLFKQVENAAISLGRMVTDMRAGRYRAPNQGMHNPREK
jgi:hypothetical protein